MRCAYAVLISLLATSAIAANDFVAKSDISTKNYNDLSSSNPDIPKDVADAIKAAANVKDVIPISGSESFAQQVVKSDEIVFDRGSHLVIKNLSAPWIAIAAKNIKFRDPINYSFIERDYTITSAPDGKNGATGAKGPDDFGETNRRGNDGHPGGPGLAGSAGSSMPLPTIYIIAGKLLDDKNQEIPAGILNLAVLARGVDGGMGGTGGRGGNGGHAGNGKEGASGGFDCKEGPGPGGNGGVAGMGGPGGPGGAGSDGGTIIFVSLKQGAETFTYARVNNQGGIGGIGGRGGPPGSPGAGGGGAGRNGWCGPSGPGSPGTYPSPVNYGDGKNGPDGKKGEMRVISVPNIDIFF
ncbi:hypothetical protein [Methylobacterium radiotolerans]|uniref:Collagen-like protein n=1 Tax=Methylobacterium radiotolerans (strain ATCC 27329 / DSM 1819 / JCM 2831 / NBRC 15690 / NCIMB 10815 / 0-1) TaxID=426355 RepID=B1MA84_METRJ|nr:hypothetical protein [Methylobacterium radiotolerans]ACB28409.1 conserved hypothetical protein [Methylobacterium radiotolerans JCM 2831]GEN01871.1 hypothetical protein MRA01_64100 [Methylobacterium radiotolerans]